jgi:hypothetical protein
MTIRVPGCSRVLLLTGVLMFTPIPFSISLMGFTAALANNAGGNGNDKGQGQSQAGGNGNGKGMGGAESAGETRSPGLASNRGRFNSLKASVSAFGGARRNSAIGAMTQYSAALSAFKTVDATDDPTVQELAAILAKVANKDELTSATIDWIHQQLLAKDMVTQTTLDEAASILAPAIDPTADSTAAAAVPPTLTDLLAEQVRLIQESKSSKGLGPIY